MSHKGAPVLHHIVGSSVFLPLFVLTTCAARVVLFSVVSVCLSVETVTPERFQIPYDHEMFRASSNSRKGVRPTVHLAMNSNTLMRQLELKGRPICGQGTTLFYSMDLVANNHRRDQGSFPTKEVWEPNNGGSSISKWEDRGV